MLITNNSASFHLWEKENLVKHQKVSKYYENDCGYWMLRYLICTVKPVYSRHAI